jgi:branched-chain amino acid transport system ATP-binding protein
MLELTNINTAYGELQVLWDISLKVEEGEIVFLIGPNGHGKTTILRTISGLIKPKSGTVRFNSTEIQKLSPRKIVERGIIHVPEGDHLFPRMTVLENLKLGAYTDKAWKSKEHNLRRIFHLFPVLDERQNQLVWSLSGGERRIVSIGRGLMSDAKLLMIDEPSLGLAPKTTNEVYQKIEEIKDAGINLLLVEQNINFVSNLANRVYLIESGKVAIEGKPGTVLSDESLKGAYLGVGN